MKKNVLDILVCPCCGQQLLIVDAVFDSVNEIEKGQLKCRTCLKTFPIIDHIPRFVPEDNYTSSFGLQWHIHAKTQIDKFNGTSITKNRFFSETNWQPSELEGKMILEAGCGAGRFTQIALDNGAICFSVDYSNAVEVCRFNNNAHPMLHLFQSDINHLPFRKNTFDKIFCFGVLQHTPVPQATFMSLIPYLKKDGEIVVDVYAAPVSWLHPRHLLRFFTPQMERGFLYRTIEYIVPRLLPISSKLRSIPLIGMILSRCIPVANYQNILQLSDKELIEWAVLDTFDWLAPKYERPQTLQNVRRWFAMAGLKKTSFQRIRAIYVGKGCKK